MQNAQSPPRLVFVGGFLGAGKTTLILKAAGLLRARGSRVAVIMNDQDERLVDTYQARQQALPTHEVAGGCFCCRFSDLVDAAAELSQYNPEIIFAEPVGSCIDLSATIIQPLLAFHRHEYQLAPLTVLVDPALLTRLQQGKMDPSIEFLFRYQIAEADLLCLTKQDIYPVPPCPWPVDFQVSSHTGFGLEEWLHEILHPTRAVGARLLDVDYDRYAAAEAALGWLNLHADLTLLSPLSPALVVGPLLDDICQELTAGAIEIAHLKVFDTTGSSWIKAALTANDAEPRLEGDLLAEPAYKHQLALNLRALAEPAALQQIVLQVLKGFGGQLQIGHLSAFQPARPIPQHRFAARHYA